MTKVSNKASKVLRCALAAATAVAFTPAVALADVASSQETPGVLESVEPALQNIVALVSDESEQQGTFTYKDAAENTWTCVISNAVTKEVTITGMDNPYQADADIVIPGTVTFGDVEYTVTALGSGTMPGDGSGTSLIGTIVIQAKTLTIPAEVKVVNSYAFANLETTDLIFAEGSQLTTICDYAFTRMGFRKDMVMESLKLPASVVTIGEAAFDRLNNCKEVDLSACSNLVSIGDGAFAVSSLPEEGEESILTSIKLDGCTSLKTIGGTAFERAATESIDLSGLTSLETIGDLAFAYNTKLESIVLPPKMTSLNSLVFEGCTALKSVDYSKCTGLESIVIDFENLPSLSFETLTLPEGLKSVSFSNSENLKSFNVPASCTSITLSNVPNITLETLGAMIGENKSKIETLKIKKNPNITSVDLEEYTSLTSCSFAYCENLATAENIPTSLTNWDDLFFYCKAMKTAPKINDNVTSMNSTFACSGLTEAPVIPASVTSLSYTFGECKDLVTVPSNMLKDFSSSLLNATFYSCTKLTAAPVIPDTVTQMPMVFQGCTSLTTAPELPSKVTNLAQTFLGCTALTEAPELPKGIDVNLKSTFSGCTSLTKAPEIPEGITSMWYTFKDCTALTEIPVLPSSCTSYIETFYGCDNATRLADGFVMPSSIYAYNDNFLWAGTEEPLVTYVSSSVDSSVTNCGAWTNWNRKLVVIADDQTTEPLSATATISGVGQVGDTATMIAEANKADATYQWYYSKDGGKSWYKASGTAATYEVVATSARAGYQYKCLVRSGGEAAFTDAVAIGLAFDASAQIGWADGRAVGKTATLSAAGAPEGATYQWYYSKDGGLSWAKSAGAAATYDVVATSARAGYQYRCLVSAKGYSEFTEPVAIGLAFEPVAEVAGFEHVGDTATLTATASEPAAAYQWYYSKDGGATWAKAAGTASEYQVQVTQARSGYQYKCLVTSEAGYRAFTDPVCFGA